MSLSLERGLADRATDLLKETQYDRAKHLENILHNTHHERFEKLPVL